MMNRKFKRTAIILTISVSISLMIQFFAK